MRPDATTGADRLPILRNGRRQRFGAIERLSGEAQKLDAAGIGDPIFAQLGSKAPAPVRQVCAAVAVRSSRVRPGLAAVWVGTLVDTLGPISWHFLLREISQPNEILSFRTFEAPPRREPCHRGVKRPSPPAPVNLPAG